MNPVQILMMNQQKSKGLGYGLLYNWYAAGHANFAPTDWAIPTYTEFNTLISNTGGTSNAGGGLKSRDTSKWSGDVVYSDTDYGFEAYGAADRDGTSGTFGELLTCTRFGAVAPYTAWPQLYIVSTSTTAFTLNATDGVNKKQGISIRLIYKGAGSAPSTIEDCDGNMYDVVQIGAQYWLKQNWKCTKLNDGTPLTKVTDNTTWANATTGNMYYCAYNNDESYV